MKPYVGARFEIIVDGKPRSMRDVEDVAQAAARLLKQNHPNSDVKIRDFAMGL